MDTLITITTSLLNENSIIYTSTQIPNNKNNETSEIDHHIDRLLAPIRQSRRLLEKNKLN